MPHIVPEIRANTELVQILLYLADLHEKTPHQKLENRQYIEAIENWFTPFKSHKAVIDTKELINYHHFNYIRPHEAAIRLDEIANDSNNPLYSWAKEVKNFSDSTNFSEYIKSESDYYNWILDNIQSCDFDNWISYIEQYFNDDSQEYHLVICPLDGNYGFNMELNQKKVAFQICCLPLYNSDGFPEWHLDYLAKGMAHEYGHCFVNPIVKEHVSMLKKHEEFFLTHKNIPVFYNLDYAVICEYFVRAFAIRFMENHTMDFPSFNINSEYESQKRSFIFIDDFVKALKNYEESHLSFSDYYKLNIERILDRSELKH